MKHLTGSLAAILALALAACPGGGGGGAGDGATAPVSPSTLTDYYSVDEDSPLVVTAGNGLLANDSNPAGGPFVAEVVSPPIAGVLVLQPDGSFTYTPAANDSGGASFTYRAIAGDVATDPTPVNIDINPVADAPVAVNDAANTVEDTAIVVPPPGVLANDSDVDADDLTAYVVVLPSHGSVAMEANGGYTYMPAANYSGPDSFSYKAKDAALSSAPATVTINVAPVNDAPVATNRVYSTDALGHLVVAAPGLLSGAADVEGGVLTVALSSPVSSGALVLNADGSFTFTSAGVLPHVATFTFTVSDGAAVSAEVTASLFVNEVDPGPIYGSDFTTFKCPALGSGGQATEVWHEATYAQDNGFVVDRTGTYAYCIAGQASALHKIKLSDGTSTVLAELPAAMVSWPNGLDIDASGRLYTTGFQNGEIIRIDPVTGEATPLGTLPALPGALLPGPSDLAVGPDGNVYVTAFNSSVGGTWVWRFNVTTGQTTPWAKAPMGADGGLVVDGTLWMGGIAMNDAGQAFVVNLDSKRVIMHQDLNADGDALDAGETTDWCDLPYDNSNDGISMGICVGVNGSVFVNVASWSGTGGFGSPLGIYWLRDRNGDGDAQDAGEATLYHDQAVAASFDMGCIGARRQ